tara:strand:+ start:1814 stop:2560 length:747 start_codon:yes stop_codon:yes gene_type:complete
MTRWVISICLAVAGCVLVASTAAPEADNPLRRRLSAERTEANTVSRFERGDGNGGFVLDRSGSSILFLADRADEVLVLDARRSAGGGTSLVTDWGLEVLRINATGGATLYTDDAPDGVIADFWEPARALRPRRADVDDVIALAELTAVSLQSLLGHPVQVDYGATPREGLGVVAEAFDLSLVGINKVHARLPGRLTRLARVRIVSSAGPDVLFDGELLEIRIDPLAGHAGRPSSERIAQTLMGGAAPA